MFWRFLICSAASLVVSLCVLADTLVVAGYTQQLNAPLIAEGDEVLAPLAPSLRLLGARASRQGAAITITTPGDNTVKLKLDSTAADVNGRHVTLAVAPREVDGDLYLPARGLAPLLNATMRYALDTHTLTLAPALSVTTMEPREDGYAIQVRSVAPLQYTSNQLSDPPRAVFDFKGAAFTGATQQIAVGRQGIERVRLSQYSTQPDVVRVVVDLSAPGIVNAGVSEQGRLVTIGVAVPPAPIDDPEPVIAPVEAATAEAETPAQLIDIAVSTLTPQQSALAIVTQGAPQIASNYDSATRQLTLSFTRTGNGIPAERLRQITDKLIAKVEVSTVEADANAVMVITLKRDAGYLIHRDNTGIHVQLGNFSLTDMVIVLDAGHGGYDSGAIGPSGLMEKTVNLDIIKRAGALLKTTGAKVLFTRDDDTFIPLDNRPGLANTRQADLFISVHCNSSAARNSNSGTQVYYKTPQSIMLATAMHQELIKGLELKDGGIRTAGFLVIRKSLMPAVLLEIAFINNTREEELLATPAFRQQAAEAVVNGVRRYAANKVWQLRRSDITAIMAGDVGETTP